MHGLKKILRVRLSEIEANKSVGASFPVEEEEFTLLISRGVLAL